MKVHFGRFEVNKVYAKVKNIWCKQNVCLRWKYSVTLSLELERVFVQFVFCTSKLRQYDETHQADKQCVKEFI